MTAIQQLTVVSQSAPTNYTALGKVALFNADGTAFAPSSFAKVAARVDVAAATSSAATGGDAPTEAEYNALRTDYLALRTAFNDLLAKMRTANVLST